MRNSYQLVRKGVILHEKMLSTREVSERLGVTRKKVTGLIRSGDLSATKLNARVFRISETDLRDFIDQRTVTTPSK